MSDNHNGDPTAAILAQLADIAEHGNPEMRDVLLDGLEAIFERYVGVEANQTQEEMPADPPRLSANVAGAVAVAAETATKPESPRERRRGFMVEWYDGYMEARVRDKEAGNDGLRKNQVDYMEKTQAWLHGVLEGEPNSGLFDLTFGTGKTILFAKIARGLGVGRRPAEGERPITALHLVPSIESGNNTLGSEIRGYKAFAPEIKVTGVFDGKKDWSGDIVLMTYAGFAMLSPEEQKLLMQRDLLYLDEAHEATSELRVEVLQPMIEEMLTIAATGTIEYSPDKGVKQSLGITTVIAKLKARESIDEGIGNGAHIMLFDTGQTVDFSDEDELSEAAAAELRNSPDRDAFIMDTVVFETERGGRGIWQCVAGNECEHAQILAERARGTEIIDLKTGKRRFIRAEAVGSFQSSRKNEEILRAQRRGELDVVFFTDYLTRAYDSDYVEYVGTANATTSFVEIAQLFGRGMRQKDVLTRYYQLIDAYKNVKSKKRIRTFLDVIEEPMYQQEMIIGRPAKDAAPKDVDHRGGYRPRRAPTVDPPEWLSELPKRLREGSQKLEGRLLDELTIVPRESPNALRDWVKIDETEIYTMFSSDPSEGDARSALLTFLENAQIPWTTVRGETFVPPHTDETAVSLFATDNDSLYIKFGDVLKELSIPRDLALMILGRIGVSRAERTFPDSKRKVLSITNAELDALRDAYNRKYPPIDPAEEIATEDLARELRRSVATINVAIAEAGRSPTLRLRYRAGDYQAPVSCMRNTTADFLRWELGVKVPDGAVLLAGLSERTGVPEEQLPALITESGLGDKLDGGKLRHGKPAQWLDEDSATTFEQWHEARNAAPAPASPEVASTPARPEKHRLPKKRPSRPDDGKKDHIDIARELGIEPHRLKSFIDRHPELGQFKGVRRTRDNGQQTIHWGGPELTKIEAAALELAISLQQQTE